MRIYFPVIFRHDPNFGDETFNTAILKAAMNGQAKVMDSLPLFMLHELTHLASNCEIRDVGLLRSSLPQNVINSLKRAKDFYGPNTKWCYGDLRCRMLTKVAHQSEINQREGKMHYWTRPGHGSPKVQCSLLQSGPMHNAESWTYALSKIYITLQMRRLSKYR